jgi:hypothetical protein
MSKNPEMTLQEAIQLYLESLILAGKSPRTIYTYNKDCEQMLAFFGQDKKLVNILPVHVSKFYQSDVLLKVAKSGKERACRTVNKTKMVLKCLLNWAKEQGYIETLPLPKPKP